jgi:hypothetical protein
MTKKKSVTDLVSIENLPAFAKQDELKTFLNIDVPAAWVKEHPAVKGHRYLPIDKVEYLLDKIFKRYRVEVLKTGMLLNTVECTIRLHYFNPVVNEWDFHDGVGACEIQTKKDSGTLKLDMTNINRGAVQMALPIAKTYAIKDAADHIGRIFGRDLNRKDLVIFGADMQLQERAAKLDNIFESESEPQI